MFGNPGAFVNGNMFAGLFGSDVGVRLDEAGRNELASMAGTGAFGPAERPMGGYLSLPGAWRVTPELAAVWVDRALAKARSLPPEVKNPKPAKKRNRLLAGDAPAPSPILPRTCQLGPAVPGAGRGNVLLGSRLLPPRVLRSPGVSPGALARPVTARQQKPGSAHGAGPCGGRGAHPALLFPELCQQVLRRGA
jgi:hypothetical protein